jgi:hypothetical protein
MSRVAHFEIPAADAARANRFYQQVFGWQMQEFGGMGYYMATTGPETEVGIDGAIMQRTSPDQLITVVISVDSLDDSLAKAIAAGATQCAPKVAIPGMGYNAYFKDTEGNVIGLWQDDANAA